MAHHFNRPSLDVVRSLPDITDHTFRDALDIAAFAELGGVSARQERCESWHLDAENRFVCGTRATALDSLVDWADDPTRLIECVTDPPAQRPCGGRWVIVDERVAPAGSAPVGEADAARFIELRCALAVVGVDLADAVIFDGDNGRWWSLCELLSGATRWGERPLPCLAMPGRRPGRG